MTSVEAFENPLIVAPANPNPLKKVVQMRKQCETEGCKKFAVCSNFCVSHGGGRRCNHPDCSKNVRDLTGFCKTHGGGRRCEFEGCDKAAADSKGFCRAHGGGKRCGYEGCGKGAEGSTRFCIAHGGGRRCQSEGCLTGARGTTRFCKQHGGGKRCTFSGCMKSGTSSSELCKAHGGGRRCQHPGCTKGAQGKTFFCKGHGGGHRCQMEGCAKAARDCTKYCKAHGGGRRCSTEGCPHSARDGSSTCKSHAKSDTLVASLAQDPSVLSPLSEEQSSTSSSSTTTTTDVKKCTMMDCPLETANGLLYCYLHSPLIGPSKASPDMCSFPGCKSSVTELPVQLEAAMIPITPSFCSVHSSMLNANSFPSLDSQLPTPTTMLNATVPFTQDVVQGESSAVPMLPSESQSQAQPPQQIMKALKPLKRKYPSSQSHPAPPTPATATPPPPSNTAAQVPVAPPVPMLVSPLTIPRLKQAKPLKRKHPPVADNNALEIEI